jgi:hypothetical protein
VATVYDAKQDLGRRCGNSAVSKQELDEETPTSMKGTRADTVTVLNKKAKKSEELDSEELNDADLEEYGREKEQQGTKVFYLKIKKTKRARAY